MEFFSDLKLAVRHMLQKPAFALTTMFIMTVGLGLCMYNYAFIHNFMLKDLPFADGDRIYVINTVENGVSYNGGTVTAPDYLAMREELQGVELMGAYYYSTVTLSGGENTTRYRGVFTEPNMFDLTAVQPLMGRVIGEQDNVPGIQPNMVIGYELWQTYFGGRADILGLEVEVDDKTSTIVGVMPEGFTFPNAINVWMPMQLDLPQYTRKAYMSVEVYVKLAPQANVDDLNVALDSMMQRIAKEYPETNGNVTAKANTYRMGMIGDGGDAILVVMLVAIAFILLLACVNVANLLLARANERAHETAIRVALGAPRARLIMQMMAESLIICSLSGVLALLLTGWGLEITMDILPGIMNGPVPFFWALSIDTHVAMATVLIVVVTTLVTGLLPALKVSGGDFNQVLRDGTRGAQSKRAGRVSKALVVFEITLSCALLTVAAALAIGTNLSHQADYGVKTDNTLVGRFEISTKNYPEKAQKVQFYEALQRELIAQPEIANATLAGSIPGTYTWFASLQIEGMEIAENQQYPRANVIRMMPGGLETLGVDAISGRLFDARDNLNSPHSAVVTQSFVDQHLAGQTDVLGKRVKIADMENSPWFTIIGVIPHQIFGQPYANVRHRPVFYTSLTQYTQSNVRAVMQGEPGKDPNVMRNALQRVLRDLDRDVPAYEISTYETIIKRNTAGMDFISNIFNLFAIAAIVLAASGIYGVMANAIGQRTQELGIRRALGAPDESVMRMLLRQGFWQLLIGALIGAPLAYLMGSQMIGLMGVQSMLINATYVLMPTLIGVIVMLATYMPARQAIELEPSVALRYE